MINLEKSDFLSFLYAERERISSINSTQGWNNWAVVGVIVSIATILYNKLLIDPGYAQYDWRNIIVMSFAAYSITIIISILLCLLGSRKEISSYSYVSTVWDSTPFFEILFVLFSNTATFIFLILYCSNVGPLISVTSGAITGFAIRLFVNIVRRRKLCIQYVANSRALNYYKDFLVSYVILLCYFVFYICKNSIFNATEFKIAALISTLICFIYFLIRINTKSQKMLNCIDYIIERYIYQGLSNEDAVAELKLAKLGGDAKYAVSKEIIEMRVLFNKGLKMETEFKEVVEEMETGKSITHLQSVEMYNKVNLFSKMIQQAHDKSNALFARLGEVLKLENAHHLSLSIEEVMGEVNSSMEIIRRWIASVRNTIPKIESCLTNCNELCNNIDCIHRQVDTTGLPINMKIRIWMNKLRAICKNIIQRIINKSQ